LLNDELILTTSFFHSHPAAALLKYLLPVFFFFSGLFIFSRHNDFGFYFHPDERGKVQQVLEKTRNFHHPLLMLTVCQRTTAVVKDLKNTKLTFQEVVEIGRWVAAVFMAGAVACLTALMLRLVSWQAAVALGVVLCFDPTLFFVAHFMKEDPAFLCALAVLFLAFSVFNRRPGLPQTLLFGAAAGLVFSSKYTGLISWVAILPALWLVRREAKMVVPGWGKTLLVFCAGMLGVFLLFNYQMITDFDKFRAGFGRELTEVVVGPHGARKTEVPHAHYIRFLMEDFPFWYWPVVGIYGWFALRSSKELFREHLVPCVILLALVIMLSFSPKVGDRYLLPVEVWVLFAMCGAAGFLAQELGKKSRLLGNGLAAALLAGVFYMQWRGNLPARGGWSETYESFTRDSFAELRTWIRGNIPLDAVLLQPEKRFLPDPELGFFDDKPKDFPQKILSQSTFIKSGSLKSAREAGVTHVVVISGRVNRYDTEVRYATNKAVQDRKARSTFYNELQSSSRLIHKVSKEWNTIMHPGFEIYELNPLPEPE